jgi:hypothetical protein
MAAMEAAAAAAENGEALLDETVSPVAGRRFTRA